MLNIKIASKLQTALMGMFANTDFATQVGFSAYPKNNQHFRMIDIVSFNGIG